MGREDIVDSGAERVVGLRTGGKPVHVLAAWRRHSLNYILCTIIVLSGAKIVSTYARYLQIA